VYAVKVSSAPFGKLRVELETSSPAIVKTVLAVLVDADSAPGVHRGPAPRPTTSHRPPRKKTPVRPRPPAKAGAAPPPPSVTAKERACIFCGTKFVPARSGQRFCSVSCADRQHRQLRAERVANGPTDAAG
jgi:hypothetical protein